MAVRAQESSCSVKVDSDILETHGREVNAEITETNREYIPDIKSKGLGGSTEQNHLLLR